VDDVGDQIEEGKRQVSDITNATREIGRDDD
jgi:hypothetical protein